VARVPIACTLSVDDAAARGKEWRRFVAGSAVDIERRGTSARLRLRDGDAELVLEGKLIAVTGSDAQIEVRDRRTSRAVGFSLDAVLAARIVVDI